MSQEEKSQREFFRAPAELTVLFGPDEPAGRQAMAMDKEMWQTQAQLESAAREILEGQGGDLSYSPLLKVLRWLDFKLDLVLYHLRFREMAEHFPHQGTTLDISGTGLGFTGEELPRRGETILVCLLLPDSPARPILAVGEVVREGQDQQGRPVAAVNFLDIGEEDRERLIRFTFQKQRKQLAKRAEEEFE